jgi:glycosyltransferase involved in cell wall biosynthesis
VTASKAHRRLLLEDGVSPHRVHSVYAGHRPDLIPDGERHELLEKLNLPVHRDDFIVLYGGNLYGDRGVEDMLQAFNQVIQKVPKAHLVVLGAGDPEIERRCRALIQSDEAQSKVHFIGRVAPSAVGGYLSVGDIGVVPNPSRKQWDYSSPIKLSEYLGAGLAVVATDLKTINEVVGPERAALLVPPESPSEMAEGIIRLLTDEKLRRSMQERALRVGVKLTYRARAESVYQFFEKLTES